MRVRPVSPSALVEEVADLIHARTDLTWVRVAVDGAPATGPHGLADSLVEPLRIRGRPVQRIRGDDFLRPASVRFERGRTDPDAYYEDRLDVAGLNREVLGNLGPEGTGRVLPTLWDPIRDRATRAGYVALARGGVVLLSGDLLLGAGLELDLVVHLEASAPALHRRTADADRWMLEAYARYADEVDPAAFADLVVRVDDPRRPAIVE